MLKGGVIAFFYVDDIVFCYRKRDDEVVEAIKKELGAKYHLGAGTLGMENYRNLCNLR